MSTSRRDFLRDTARLTGAAALAGGTLWEARAEESKPPARAVPHRVLGRTKIETSMVGIGMAPVGSRNTTPADLERIVGTALDEGITYVDVAPDYGNAESKLKTALAGRRDRLFLVTKIEPNRADSAGVQKQLEESLARLGVDHVDAVHIHNVGSFSLDTLYAPDGTIAGLKEARKRGLTRFIAASGHMRPARFVRLIETGEIDLTMIPLNFADRDTYNFEGLVLPVAAKHGTAVVAMKVLGGAIGWRYDGRTPGCLAEHYDRAVRYSLGLPGVACAVVGVANPDEVRRLAAAARAFRPLSEAERAVLLDEGRAIGEKRGKYYGAIEG